MMLGDLMTLRAEVRAWLDENIPRDLVLPSSGQALGPDLEAWAVDFRRKLGAKGWLAPSWPTYFGGGGLPVAAGAVIMEELKRRSLPPLGISLVWLVPLRVWGTEEQKARWLPPILRGEVTVFQIMSEPAGGADLASQTTTAFRDGDEYVVNGEKGHTGAPFQPDYLFILVTMDPQGPKYQNLGMLMVDVHDPGVTIQHRRIVTGGNYRSFVLKDVRVPAEDIIGGEMGGWLVAQTLVDVERGGEGVTPEQQREVEEREREYWEKAAT